MITKHFLFAGILKNVRLWHLTPTLRNPVQKILSAYDHFLDRLEKNKKKGRLDKKEEFYSWSEFVHFLATNKPKQTSNKLLSEIDMTSKNQEEINKSVTSAIVKSASLSIPKGCRRKYKPFWNENLGSN